ncbi:hypothetical protein ABG768_007679 [Culter alburnus]|uniref:G-protein coupled receptors family 1 profile domain-containing protein n=1 Tax=Culter alburnus TaxID=194366 RepID=A0AAW1ZPM6_CULAL
MENLSIIVSFELTLDPFYIPPGAKYPIFLFGLFIYMFIAFCNLTLLLLIIMTQSLHKPIYFIMFSLPLNDFVGITSMLPKVLSDIVMETNNTYYPLCVLQGFLIHMYGGGVLFILAAMAFDRYIAICMPLRYNALMTPRFVMGIVSIVWGLDLFFIVLLFSLQSKYSRCRSIILNVFCDNPSLLKMTCDNTSVSNIIGLFTTAMMQIISVCIQVFSYVKILIACLATSRSDAKRKAINTCVSQLAIFIIYEVVGTFTILSHRFKNINADMQKIMGMLIFLVSPLLNPIVYGLNSHELRNNLLKLIHRKISKM